MIIYATEFVLWCGIFACGGYYNLAPWVRMKMSKRESRKMEVRERQVEMENGGTSNDIELETLPSATSVFRTSSSAVSASGQSRSRGPGVE
jgi:hypothetical protein